MFFLQKIRLYKYNNVYLCLRNVYKCITQNINCMKKLLFTLLFAAAGTLTAWAGYGWYGGSITIGGSTTDCTAWSTDSNNPTDLGIVTNMTVTSVAFNIWSDANDRGGANIFFRIWDGGSSQVGEDQNLWLGDGTRIEGKEHDFAISWTGTLNLASAVGLTLVPGKTYYIDMYAKSYSSNSVDEWYSNNMSNYHAKLTIATDINITLADDDASIGSVIAGYRGVVANVNMTRTLKGGKWNTFCVPFDMEISELGTGAEVKELTGATLNGNNYSMTFGNASTIEAGKAYMVRVPSDVTSLSLSNKTIKSTITPTTKDGVTFTGVYNNGNAPMGSFIISNNVFYNVDSDVTLKAFRGYITVGSGGVKALTFDFDDDATSLNEELRMKNEELEGSIYNLAGQRINKMQRGINIVNGKKILFK